MLSRASARLPSLAERVLFLQIAWTVKETTHDNH